MTTRRARGQGSIGKKRADGRYPATLDLGRVDGKRKRKSVYGRTTAEAAEELRKIQSKHDVGLPVGDRRTTLAVLVEAWLALQRAGERSPNTVDNYEWATRHLVSALGPKRLLDLSTDDVERWLRREADAGLSRSCVPASQRARGSPTSC